MGMIGGFSDIMAFLLRLRRGSAPGKIARKGDALSKEGRDEEALKCYDRAIEINLLC